MHLSSNSRDLRDTISVVIPTRNRASMTLAAVASVFAQTHAPHEVIVVIDGPEDAGDTLESLSAVGDPRLRVLSLPASVGGGEARNLGVRAGTGEWIAFLDDDDLWLPRKLETQLAFARALENSAAATAETAHILSCPVLARSPEWERVWPRQPYRAGRPMSEYLFCRRGWRYGSALLQTSTLVAPREFLLRVPFTRGLRKHQDWDWLLRAASEPGVSVHSVGSEPLAVFHVEGQRASVGRAPDWRFSLNWARERRRCFTRRAFTAFLATECAAQVSGRPWRERAALLRAFLFEGTPLPSALLRFAAFLLVPQALRRRLRDLRRRS